MFANSQDMQVLIQRLNAALDVIALMIAQFMQPFVQPFTLSEAHRARATAE